MTDIQKTTDSKVQVGGPSKIIPDDTLVASPSLARRSFDPHHPSKPGRGRFTKATPELTRAAHNIQEAETHLDHDIVRLTEDKARLSEQIKDLQTQLQTARTTTVSKATIKRLDALLAEARDRLTMLSGIIPETAVTRDRATMELILKKWREYDHERTLQAAAENRFDKNPEDKRSEGDINRARAAAYALNQEIEFLAEQGEEHVAEGTPDTTTSSGVVFSHEQTLTDKKTRAEAAPTEVSALAPVPQIVVPGSIDTVEPLTKEELPTTAPESFVEKPAVEIIVPSAIDRVEPVIKEVLPTFSAEQIEKTERVLTMPQEIIPSDPKVLAYTEARVRNHINSLFGKSGFLGIGSKEGVDSPHWKDPFSGFAGKTVSKILKIEVKVPLEEDQSQIGINSWSATKKMQNYLMFAIDNTSVQPEPDEKISDYVNRATAITINKLMTERGLLSIPSKSPVDYSKKDHAATEEILPKKAAVPMSTVEPISASVLVAIASEEAKTEVPHEIIESKVEPALVFPSTTEFDLDPVIWEDIHPSLEEPIVPLVVSTPEIKKIESMPEIVPAVIVSTEPSLKTETIVELMVKEPEFSSVPEVVIESVGPATDTSIPAADKPSTESDLVSTPENAPSDLAAVIAEAAPTQQPVQLMPQSILPNNPQIIAYADTEVNKHLDILFGKPGIFGFGRKKGIDSGHWKDPLFGFGGKTVAEILEVEPEENPAPGLKKIGITDKAATQKIQEYLILALSETGVHPEPEESVEDFLRRAAAITIDKYLQKEKLKP